jgi:hypothetical protein
MFTGTSEELIASFFMIEKVTRANKNRAQSLLAGLHPPPCRWRWYVTPIFVVKLVPDYTTSHAKQ